MITHRVFPSLGRRIAATIARLRRVSLRHLVPDLVLLTTSLFASLWLRLGWPDALTHLSVLVRHLPVFLGVRLVVFVLDGVYDTIWRHFGVSDALRLARSFLVALVLVLALSLVLDLGRLPRAIFFIDAMLAFLLLSGLRLLRRLVFEARAGGRPGGRRAVVFGAGIVGRLLVQRVSTDAASGIEVIGFVDDDPRKAGRKIAGQKVLGNRTDLEGMLAQVKAQELIVAMKHPPGDVLREVVQRCRNVGVPVRIVAGLQANESGVTAEPIRPVTLSDLLNRPSRNVPTGSIDTMVRGRCVLVTGAGGSIGSELVRQILTHEPATLLLVEHSEFALFQIHSEIQSRADQNTAVVPLLLDVRDRARIFSIFEQYRPQLVVHAAAYKHVHLVESNPIAAILNNVAGTLNVLEAADLVATERFVLISTDKAVNPGGIMGATKRVCERIVTAVGLLRKRNYCSVRFGNVLGSSGSLIPTLMKQIEAGAPVSVTHPEMERYFMLIPEAVSLVLRAATLVDPGAIAILRMGEPVKIVDLVKSLIALTGRTEETSPIVFTGPRPGEKLREELYLQGDELLTEDPDVLVLPRNEDGGSAAHESVLATVRTLVDLAESNDPRTLALLRQLSGLKVSTHVGAVRPETRPTSSASAELQ
jgi:FlaA1/EpsC-like NDP-sugar epimerase